MRRLSLRRLRPFTMALAVAIVVCGGSFLRPTARPTVGAAPAAAATIEIAIREFAYDPPMTVIAPGTTVRWTNYDGPKHTVTGTGTATDIRSPLLGQGESFEYTFTQPGIYAYKCSPHPYMVAQVEVRGTPTGTGFEARGAILAYWTTHGLDFGEPGISYRESLALFGLPISAEKTETIEGKPYTVQYFERARFELHPENQAPYDVLLGQFGRILHPADPAVAQQPGAMFFPETGHNLGGRFQEYWMRNGGLPIFGLPLTEPFRETLGGQEYTVQYFERARFELHPENQAPYDVLLGQFGRQVLDGQGAR